MHRFGYGARKSIRKVSWAVGFAVLSSTAFAETTTIAALGDSLTQGYGLPVEDGFVPQLEAWLKEQGLDIAVNNAGVSGDTTAGGLSRVDWTLTPEVDAMIVALGGNDLLRGIDPEASRANLEGILKVAQARNLPVLLVGMEAPGNYGPDYKKAFDSMYPDLAESYGALLFPTFFEGMAELGDREAAIRELMQPDGIHPNAKGVDRIVRSMGPAVIDLVNQID